MMEITSAISPSSRIYEYGIRLNPAIEGQAELIDKQCRLAHEMYNSCVTVSRNVLAEIIDLLLSNNDELKNLHDLIECMYVDRKEARKNDDRDRFESITKEIKTLKVAYFKLLYETKKECKDDLKPMYAKMSIMKKESLIYQARTAYVKAGLYWGTAGAVMKAIDAAWKKQLPRLRKIDYKNTGETNHWVLSSPVNDRPGGLTQVELFDGTYRIAVTGVGKYKNLKIRIAPDGVDTHCTIQMDRPFPPGATITEARLVIRRVGRTKKYYAQFQLANVPVVAHKIDARGVAGISLGWYQDWETRRIGAVADTSDHNDARAFFLPQDVLDGLKRVSELQSQRDTSRDDMVEKIKALEVGSVQDEMLWRKIKEIAGKKTQWTSSAALAEFATFWNDACPTDNSDMCETLERWRRSDMKLYETLSHLRRKSLNRRRDFYRNMAAKWAKKYHTIMIHQLDLAAMARIKNEDTGEHTVLDPFARYGRVAASLYELESAIENAAAQAGTRVVRISDGTASTCNECGERIELFAGRSVAGRCEHCNADLERRSNGAANLHGYYFSHRDDIETATNQAVAAHEGRQEKAKEKKKWLADGRRQRSQKDADAVDFRPDIE